MSPQSNKGPSGSPKPQLAVREWLAVIILIGAFTLITIVSFLNDRSIPENVNNNAHFLKPQHIDVHIQGAVINPGNYKLKIDSKLKDLLTLAIPNDEADLKLLKLDSKLRNGQVVKVTVKPYISINVSGAVKNPGTILVPKGTSLRDISQYVQFTQGANLDKMNRKRILKDEENIHVPSKISREGIVE